MTAFTSTTITATGYGSLVLPGYVTKVIVEAWGAGGGATGGSAVGAGGGGGAYARANLYVTGGETLFYFVGRGGAGQTASVLGGNGQASWATLSSNAQPTVVGNYGTGAGVYANGGIGGGTVGGVGAGGTIWIYADVDWAGGTGGSGPATGNPRGGGGGGGSAGSASAGGTGGNGSTTAGLRGSPGTADTFSDTFQEVILSTSVGAFGGNGIVTTGNLSSGSSPGGGGGGGYATAGIYGGNGGDGQIRISYNQKWIPAST